MNEHHTMKSAHGVSDAPHHTQTRVYFRCMYLFIYFLKKERRRKNSMKNAKKFLQETN